ncbi:MAG: aromatic ring-hydroxylating oxygenase subunit alpha [Acidobacteriota bacterium]
MSDSLGKIINSYDPSAPLERAYTIPAAWYTDERVFELEQRTVFSQSWQAAARVDQFRAPGDYVTSEIADEPVVVVRGSDNQIRAFFNVCSHHAAAVMTEPHGNSPQMRCPYHGWTYSLEGELKGTPDFSEVCDFDRGGNGLIPVEVAVWQNWVFVKTDGGQRLPLDKPVEGNDGGQRPPLDKPVESLEAGVARRTPDGETIESWLGEKLVNELAELGLSNLHWFERRKYAIDCNWKVFVDNYLDGGYHVPHLHKGLDSVLDYSNYTIECGGRHCLQSSPMVNSAGSSPPLNKPDKFRGGQTPAHRDVADTRTGERALYYWIYPNFMINCYAGVMDTNLVRPISVDRTEVIFDFYFADVSEKARGRNLASVAVGDRIQQEDLDICASVQRGLKSRVYDAGRLSVRREAGEHLFHRLLHADFKAGV